MFTESDPTLAQGDAQCYMPGPPFKSFEAGTGRASFQPSASRTCFASNYSKKFVRERTGHGQAQGLKGNYGRGVTGVVTGSDGYGVRTHDSLFHSPGLLQGSYFPGHPG